MAHTLDTFQQNNLTAINPATFIKTCGFDLPDIGNPNRQLRVKKNIISAITLSDYMEIT